MFKEGVQLSNTAIVYASSHHYNTKKIVYAMAEECKIDIFDLKEVGGVDLSAYDHIGFASGIYYGKFDRKLTEFIKNLSLSDSTKVFIIYTSGIEKERYARKMEEFIAEKACTLSGIFSCRGYNTYGPFKLIGGIAKAHPDANDLIDAKAFIRGITSM